MSFKVKFSCWNCGKNWEQEFQKGTLVDEDLAVKGIGISVDKDGETRYLACPSCGSVSSLMIERRIKPK